jgi:multiple sugar transport system substrate-binding protein
VSSVLLACILAATLVSCSDGGNADAGPTPTSAATSASSPSVVAGPLTLSVYGEPEAVRAYRNVAEDFTEETGVEVEVQVHPSASRAGGDVLRRLDGAGSAPDVFLLAPESLPDALATERLQPVDEELEQRGLQFGDGYQRTALTAFSAEDNLQCMPVDMSPYVMFINRDLVRPRDLAIRGVPLPEQRQWLFEDFAAAARLIAREQQGVEGFKSVHLPLDIEPLTAFVRSGGGDVVDDVDQPGELTLDTDEARTALLAYLRLARQRSVALSEEEAEEVAPADRFADGRLAMMFGTRADVPDLRRTGVPFDVMPLPSLGTPRTVADIAGLCVDQQGTQLETALDLVAFVAGNDASTTLARSGAVLPANLDVAFSPAFAQAGQLPRSVQVFRDSLERSGLMPFSTAWPEVSARVEAVLARVVDGSGGVGRSLDRWLPRLDEQSQPVFEEAQQPEGD